MWIYIYTQSKKIQILHNYILWTTGFFPLNIKGQSYKFLGQEYIVHSVATITLIKNVSSHFCMAAMAKKRDSIGPTQTQGSRHENLLYFRTKYRLRKPR